MGKWELLLVEDRPMDAQLLQAAFQEVDRRAIIHHVQTAEEAVRVLRERLATNKPLPDMTVLDLNLPKQHGRTVLTEIKGNPKLQDIPVIVWTSSVEEDDVTRCSDLRADSYMLKPSSWDEFMETAIYVSNFADASSELPPIWPLTRSAETVPYEHLRNTCERVHKMMTASSPATRKKWAPVILLTLAVQRMLEGLEKHHGTLLGDNHHYHELIEETPRLMPHFEKLKETIHALERNGNELATELGSLPRHSDTKLFEIQEELGKLLSHVRCFVSRESDLIYEQFKETPALD